jgi:hypothetical protein
MTRPEKQLILSANGLTNWQRGIYENDFTFILQDARYDCPLFIATFLSPRVANLLSSDPTIRELQIKTRDPNHFFTGVLGLAEGRAVQLTAANSQFFCSVGVELKNQEMAGFINGALTLDTAIARLLLLFDLNADVDCEIAFCSLHFHELKQDEIDQLPLEIVEAIVCHRSLKLQDEDSLFEFIRRVVVRDGRFAVLLANVCFEHLSRDSIESFVGLISECFEFLSAAVWESVAKRLVLSVSTPASRDRFLQPWVEYGYAEGRSLNGIIAHLSRKGGGSVIDTGVVSVTASGIGHPPPSPLRVLADFGCGINCFYTPNVPNSWVCYDFGSARVRLTHYAVRSALKPDSWHLRSWNLRVRLTGNRGSFWTIAGMTRH